jgi:hypothetical protein
MAQAASAWAGVFAVGLFTASNRDRTGDVQLESKHLSENYPQKVFTEFWLF